MSEHHNKDSITTRRLLCCPSPPHHRSKLGSAPSRVILGLEALFKTPRSTCVVMESVGGMKNPIPPTNPVAGKTRKSQVGHLINTTVISSGEPASRHALARSGYNRQTKQPVLHRLIGPSRFPCTRLRVWVPGCQSRNVI
jgi:hypothetical protein